MKIKSIMLLTIIVGLIACGKNSNEKNSETTVNDSTETMVATNEPTRNTNAQIYAKREVPILCYHRIENGRNDEYTVAPATFARQIQALADSGYHTINPDQLYDYLVYNKELPDKPVMITFDDSRVQQAVIAAPELEKHNFTGVFFLMTIAHNKKNYMSDEQILDLDKRGHTIALHSWDHTKATKYDNDSIFQQNIVQPRKKLAEMIGKPIDYFAYPYGLTDDKTNKIMNDNNFKLSFILSTKQDSIYPLQTVRRIISLDMAPEKLMRSMKNSFNKNR